MQYSSYQPEANEAIRTASPSLEIERAAMLPSVARSAVTGADASHLAEFQRRREAFRLALAALED